MIAELSEAYRRCDFDDGVPAVVLTGTPPAFCAGVRPNDFQHFTATQFTGADVCEQWRSLRHGDPSVTQAPKSQS
jgi:enoyl-CoA hydratase/carnithine racemase